MNPVTITSCYLKFRLSRYLNVVLLVFGILFFSNYGNTSSVPTKTNPAKDTEQLQKVQIFKPELTEKWGIELTALRMTAAGHMVDFRYRIIDKEKSAPLHKRQIKPYLVHQASGKVLAVPNTAKIGALRNSNMPQEGRIYWMFFGNNGLVKKGDKVSVVIGEFRADDLVVE